MANVASPESIIIVGAGIIGLNVALVLAEQGYGSMITVVAAHLPGDTALTYTSPYAGCNFSAISGSDPNALRWDQLGYSHLCKLASQEPHRSFVQRTPSIEMWDENVPNEKIKHMSEYLEDFRILGAEELPQGVKFAVSFTTLTINAPKHIEYLRSRLENDYGVRFLRKTVPHLHDAFSNSATQVVFNCIGNAARIMPGVEDSKCYPTRGQVVLMKAPSVRTNIMRHGRDYETYVIPRPQSNGNVVLGGYMQKENDDGATYAHETESIVQRTTELSQELRQGEQELIAAMSGFRPSREGGARVERESVVVGGKPKTVIHNYGAGGTGYQGGYGMAVDAVQAAESILQGLKLHSRL
ncbi:NAD(P)-binding domain [Cordyceps militaris]|uniref:NAD(P)-binding domain n=1 Tax=Cordyceps militaris TaxID=73501 RepID=A0A2H4SHZ3_CORMI|nr:NAD(P)-binding domain [Cordyceps militaris]